MIQNDDDVRDMIAMRNDDGFSGKYGESLRESLERWRKIQAEKAAMKAYAIQCAREKRASNGKQE